MKIRLNSTTYRKRKGFGIPRLANRIRKKIEGLPPLSSKCCIFKVPRPLRSVRPEAYNPRLVSVGPLHYGVRRLRSMREQKLRYVQDLLWRNNDRTLKDYLRAIKGWEGEIREYYLQPIHMNSNEFVEMVFLDACFVIEYFIKSRLEAPEENDRIFDKPCLSHVIRRDLLLIENQLPFFVLQRLYDLVFDEVSCPPELPLVNLVSAVLGEDSEDFGPKLEGHEILHLVDVMRTNCLPSQYKEEDYTTESINLSSCPCARDLHDARMKFVVSDSDCWLDAKFENGVLELPQIDVHESTEAYILNLSAFEQFYYRYDAYIVDFTLLLDSLIKSIKDVEILMSNGIITMSVGNVDDMARIFFTISKEASYDPCKFYYADLRTSLTEYSETRWNQWKATLKHDYFGNPWAIISCAAAIFLLILTVVQTYCSILSLPP